MNTVAAEAAKPATQGTAFHGNVGCRAAGRPMEGRWLAAPRTDAPNTTRQQDQHVPHLRQHGSV